MGKGKSMMDPQHIARDEILKPGKAKEYFMRRNESFSRGFSMYVAVSVPCKL